MQFLPFGAKMQESVAITFGMSKTYTVSPKRQRTGIKMMTSYLSTEKHGAGLAYANSLEKQLVKAQNLSQKLAKAIYEAKSLDSKLTAQLEYEANNAEVNRLLLAHAEAVADLKKQSRLSAHEQNLMMAQAEYTSKLIDLANLATKIEGLEKILNDFKAENNL